MQTTCPGGSLILIPLRYLHAKELYTVSLHIQPISIIQRVVFNLYYELLFTILNSDTNAVDIPVGNNLLGLLMGLIADFSI